MATVSMYKTGATHISLAANVKPVYQVEAIVDFAAVLAAKGSALAALDVIEALRIPAGSVVLGAGAAVVVTADSTTLTLDVGTGVDADEWAAGLNGKAAAGTYSTDLNADTNWKTFGTADTIDITLATLTGTLSTGKVRVYALVMDVSGKDAAGIVQLGS